VCSDTLKLADLRVGFFVSGAVFGTGRVARKPAPESSPSSSD
jgi:hypothetical protein